MRITRQNFLLVLPLLVLCGTTDAQSTDLELTVQVRGGIEHVGQVIVSLFSSPENFLSEPVYEKSDLIDETGGAEIVFPGLAEGEYAVSVIYDEDNDGELKTGLFGIPTEKVGFSNDAKGIIGPPSFRKASFKLLTSSTIVTNLDNAKE